MSGCEKYQEMISALCDGELLGDKRLSELSGHIRVCDGCRRAYNAFMELGDCLRQSQAEVPEGFTETVMERISEKTAAQKRPRLRSRGRAALAACLALIAGAGIWMLTRNGLPGDGTFSGVVVESADGLRDFRPDETTPSSDDENSGGETEAQPKKPEPGGGFMAEARIYSAGTATLFSNAGLLEQEPVLTAMDQETLDALFALLDFSETGIFTSNGAEPAYIMALTYLDGGVFELRLWVVDGYIYANGPGGGYYKSGCDLGGFLTFILEQ